MAQIFQVFLNIIGENLFNLFGIGFFVILFFGIYDLVVK